MQSISFTNLSFFETTNLVEFVVTWQPPVFPNGVLELFQLRVGLEEIEPSDDVILNSHAFRRNNIQVSFHCLYYICLFDTCLKLLVKT